MCVHVEYFVRQLNLTFNYLTCIQLNLISQLLDYWNNHGFPTELETFFV